METMPARPRVWVSCLRAYNAGTLHGHWVDVDGDEADLAEAIDDVLRSSPEHTPDDPCEEWAFHDHECLPGIGEHSTLSEVVATAGLVFGHGHDVVAAAFSVCADVSEARELIEDGYRGRFSSLAEYAETLYVDIYGEDQLGPLVGYIDWERVADELEVSGVETARGVHVFEHR